MDAEQPSPERAETAVASLKPKPKRRWWSKTARGSKSRVRFGVVVALGAFAAGAVFTAFASLAAAGDGPYDVVRQLGRVLVLVENEYVDPVERSRLLEGAIKGMVGELDPHSSYLPPEDYDIFEADTKGEFGGIGVEVDFRNEAVVVIAPIEGSPADRAGIRSGDRIFAIDGTPVRDKPMQDLVRLMRGKPGTRVIVSVSRGSEERILHFTLSRQIIQVSSVVSKMLDGRVLYLRIKQFQSGTHDEMLDAIGKMRAEAGAFTGVVLDLRSDPGGLVDEASGVADEFLGGGVIYTTRHRGQTVDEVRAGPGGALSVEPLVVLVNEYSASASELLAGALQDQKRATIVGAQTFGKGSVQTIIDLPGGAGLRLTTMWYYTPGGHAIQAEGITPDVRVDGTFVPDQHVGLIRESDLENHLPAEGTAPAPPSSAEPVADGGTPEMPPSTPKEIPINPTGGKDLALSIGYQIVKGVLHR